MDYKKYLKVLGLVAALVVAYGAGRHFAPRPAAIPHPKPQNPKTPKPRKV